MKKFLCLALAIVGVIFGLNIMPSYASSKYTFSTMFNGSEITIESIEQDLCDFVYGENMGTETPGERADRTAGTIGEQNARDYLVTELKEIFGIPQDEDSNDTNYVRTQMVSYRTSMSNTASTYNVVGLKASNLENTDYVVIGAHYDNFYGYSDDLFGESSSQSHGIYDNASGVTALLNIAKLLQDKALPFDVFYVFFGAEEAGRYGSLGFYEGFVEEYQGDMKLMINLDSIGNGDNLYMYSAEVDTVHEEYFRELSKVCNDTFFKFGEEFKSAPKNKKVDYMVPAGDISYSHMGLNSDNSSFMHQGNNVISFFSGAWDAKGTGVFESSINDNVMHTQNDNITKIKELYGDLFFERIKQVSYLCATALIQEDFVEVMDESSKTSSDYIFFTNGLYANLIMCAFLFAGFAVYIKFIKRFKDREPDGKFDQLKKAVMENKIDEIYSRPEQDVTEIVIEDDKTDDQDSKEDNQHKNNE